MRLKQIPEDFRVDELYDLKVLGQKKNESETEKLNFGYFELWKRDFTTQRAIEYVCRAFRLQARDVHFAGTKDRIAVTTQLISIRRLRKEWEKDLKYFNDKNPDIKLRFLGMFPSRLNLGDNLGNKFEITVRDLEEKDICILNKNLPLIKKHGILNFFDSQRFGFGGKNPVIGKYFLLGDFEKAFFHILTALPNDAKDEHRKFVDYLTENWKQIVESNNWNKVLKILPEWLRIEKRMIEWVIRSRNDFLGAMGLIHKKIRTMYVNSYQSYLFNEMIKYLDSLGKLEEYSELPMVAAETSLSGDWGEFVCSLLLKDGLDLSCFEMKRSPTLRPREVVRSTFVKVKRLIVGQSDNRTIGEKDELNEGRKKVVLSFELEAGAYATNVVKVLFEKQNN